MSEDILRGLKGQYNLLKSQLVTERKVMFFFSTGFVSVVQRIVIIIYLIIFCLVDINHSDVFPWKFLRFGHLIDTISGHLCTRRHISCSIIGVETSIVNS